MAGASESYHEPLDRLSEHTMNMHRALVSLQEELEAVDWYQQRADGTPDQALKEILLHNMREEIEHASMVLEWLRRSSPDFDAQLRDYLFTEGPITELEEEANGGGEDSGDEDGPDERQSTIGPLKGE
ncbi:encapsulin-associated ferritin-like protein [Thiohalorhabdus methylotrophus]|uniref:Encapsulin-associated ferritin-like protein n=1 Tax=Thiohalorhabdus methylotrophus TaxID=3242694 RepID=A0ABV4TSN7_9GAMM